MHYRTEKGGSKVSETLVYETEEGWRDNLKLHEMTGEGDVITLTASSLRPSATCPDCHRPSSREHSRYRRAPDEEYPLCEAPGVG